MQIPASQPGNGVNWNSGLGQSHQQLTTIARNCRIGNYGFADVEFNLRTIDNQIQYRLDNPGSGRQRIPVPKEVNIGKLAQLFQIETPLAIFKPDHEGRELVVAKLNNVFIAFRPGGKGSQMFQLFYKSDDGKIAKLDETTTIKRWPSISADAYLPVDVNAFYSSFTSTALWDFNICGQKKANPQLADFDTYDLIEDDRGNFHWKDCETGALKSMPRLEFEKMLQVQSHGVIEKLDSIESLYRTLNHSSYMCPWPLIKFLKEAHGFACQASKHLPQALAFRQSVVDLIEKKISLSEFLTAHKTDDKEMTASEAANEIFKPLSVEGWPISF